MYVPGTFSAEKSMGTFCGRFWVSRSWKGSVYLLNGVHEEAGKVIGSNGSGNQLAGFVERLRRGDQSAFLPLYEKTAPGLMRFLLWKTGGDKPLSEDILQDSFVRFLCAIDRLESLEEVSIQSYLMRIVKNCWVDKVARSPHAARPHVTMDSLLDLADPDTSSGQERAVELRELAIAMKSLNEKDSQIIWLRDGLGLSHREVADQVGITEQASRQAYVRAKRALISKLSSTFFPNPEVVEGYVANEAT